MKLGAFSVSLPVSDLERSRLFYEALGFEAIGGAGDEGYLMLRNGSTVLGLFAFDGLDFEAPMLTFNPGMTQDLGQTDDFTDVREVSRRLRGEGITPDPDCDPGESGPAHLGLVDPDGHRILVDQFYDAP